MLGCVFLIPIPITGLIRSDIYPSGVVYELSSSRPHPASASRRHRYDFPRKGPALQPLVRRAQGRPHRGLALTRVPLGRRRRHPARQRAYSHPDLCALHTEKGGIVTQAYRPLGFSPMGLDDWPTLPDMAIDVQGAMPPLRLSSSFLCHEIQDKTGTGNEQGPLQPACFSDGPSPFAATAASLRRPSPS